MVMVKKEYDISHNHFVSRMIYAYETYVTEIKYIKYDKIFILYYIYDHMMHTNVQYYNIYVYQH